MLTIYNVTAVCGVLYVVGGAVYRLFLSPIAKIPGPKLAALTFWYEFWYDVVKRGQYEFRLMELHRQYGPIMRINPCEVHIADPSYYDELYAGRGRKVDKWQFAANLSGSPGTLFSTTDHDQHRVRRVPLDPWFSKKAARGLEPMLYETIDRMIETVERSRAEGSVLRLTYLLSGFATDVVTKIMFGTSFGFGQDVDAAEEWALLLMNGMAMSALMKQYPSIARLRREMPPWLLRWIDPRLTSIHAMYKMFDEKITGVRKAGKTWSGDNAPSMIQEMVHGSLPDAEKHQDRLVDECFGVVAAGSLTVAETLSTFMFHMIDQPACMKQLQDELRPVMERTGGRPQLKDLEKLPYLTACLKEGLRLTSGAAQRSPRIHRHALVFGEYTIPPGTPVSMSVIAMHYDPSSFDDPKSFSPSRWLTGDTNLERFFVVFGKGSRSCLGLNLAWAELYLSAAQILSPDRFTFLLHETDKSDVEPVHEFLVPLPKLDSRRVRVLVR
ncbi:putative P450 monooxygenase [Xylariaceae sp. FL0804]|nr:putative P450 monooxygenase [Xylariaceae sp. FL0804]